MPALDPTVVHEIAETARSRGEELAALAVERVVRELSLDFATRRNLEIGTRTAIERFLDVLESPMPSSTPPSTSRTAGRSAQRAARCASSC